MSTQKIADLNGIWSKLFRIALAVNTLAVVPLLGWGTYVTVSLFEVQKELAVSNKGIESFISSGPRYSSIDAQRDAALQKAELQVKLSDLSTSIDVLGVKMEVMSDTLTELKKNLNGANDQYQKLTSCHRNS